MIGRNLLAAAWFLCIGYGCMDPLDFFLSWGFILIFEISYLWLSCIIIERIIFGRPFVKRFSLSYRTRCLSVLSCLSVTLVYCGQMVRWIKMKFGMQVSLGPGHIVLDGDPASPRKGAQQPPTFEIYGRRLCLRSASV